MPTISLIRIHPIKGLPPADVTAARVLPSGALELDRRWALVDARGRFVNGKNVAAIHTLHAQFDVTVLEVTVDGRTFSLTRQGAELAAWCGERLGQAVTWTENAEVGFPDDLEATGPTLVGAASVGAVAAWFGLTVDGTRRRFEVQAINPCARCVVPSRDAHTGEALAGFQKRFAELRQQHLPPGTSTALFSHYYRFTVNTRIAANEAGKVIRVGDVVTQA
jgi:uncharacterized protein YcbX